MSSMQPRPVVRPSNGQWNADDAADRLVTEEDLAKRNGQTVPASSQPVVNQLPPMPNGEPAKRSNTDLVPAPDQPLAGFGWGERRHIERQKRIITGIADLLIECCRAGQVPLHFAVTPDGHVMGELHCLVDCDGMLQSIRAAAIIVG